MRYTAELGSRLNVVGAVAFMSAEIVSGVYAGNRPAMAPASTASLFAHVNLSSSLALNGEVKYVGKRYADYGKAFYLDWYSSYNLGAQYQFNLLEAKPLLRISVKNLFDTDYYTAIVGDVRVLGNRFVVKYIGNDVLVTVEEGRVMLLDQSSNAVVAELNRYFPEDIRLATTSKTPPHLTAVIKLTDLASTVASLEATLNLDAYYDAENNVVLQQK